MLNFWQTGSSRILKIQRFPLSMSILGQKACILGPTIFRIPQPNWYYRHTYLWHKFCSETVGWINFLLVYAFKVRLDLLSLPWNSNQGRENHKKVIRSRSVNKFLFSVAYETHSKPNMIKPRRKIVFLFIFFKLYHKYLWHKFCSETMGWLNFLLVYALEG